MKKFVHGKFSHFICSDSTLYRLRLSLKSFEPENVKFILAAYESGCLYVYNTLLQILLATP